MELYRDCFDDCSYFMRARTIAKKTENKVGMCASLLYIFQNARQQTLFSRFNAVESVLKRAKFVIALI